MRIGIVTAPFYPVPPESFGPIEALAYDLIRGLTEMGHEVILFGPADSRVDCEIMAVCERSLPVEREFEDEIQLWRKRQGIQEKTIAMLKKNLCRLDIVHSLEVDIKDLADFPSVTTVSSPFNIHNIDYFAERRDLFYINISNAQKRIYPEMNYVATIYYGLDPSRFEFIEKPGDHLSFVGRISEEKGPHKALELAVKKNMPVKMGGVIMYMEKDYFAKSIKHFIYHPLVEFYGEVGLKEKNEIFGGAKCNLHLISFREPFGLTVLEAAYCGTPTLAMKIGSMPEVIENGKTGILVEDQLEAYLRLEECFSLDRKYIAARSRQMFNYKLMSRQYTAAYRKVIEAYKKGLRANKGALANFLKASQKEIYGIWEKAARTEEKPVKPGIEELLMRTPPK